MSDVSTIERMPKPIDEARLQLQQMNSQFQAALPAHIPAERFARVVMTALQNNPTLLKCERRSLWNAAMRAAQDGLLPDGREGAMAPYKDRDGNFQAQWMPMIFGIRKKARNSGEIGTWEAYCVYENDAFEFELGDEPFIRHKPALGDRGKIIAAYSIATLKDGSKSREVMSIKEVEEVRAKSKAKNGPWDDATFYPEMVRKTVARRHSKVLPMSSDLDDLIRRDDDLYDVAGAREEAQAARGGKPQSLAGALDNLAKLPAPKADAPASAVVDAKPIGNEPGDGIPAFLDRTKPVPPTREQLLRDLKETKSPQDCLHWSLTVSAMEHLTKDDMRIINSALLAHQKTITDAQTDPPKPAKANSAGKDERVPVDAY